MPGPLPLSPFEPDAVDRLVGGLLDWVPPEARPAPGTMGRFMAVPSPRRRAALLEEGRPPMRGRRRVAVPDPAGRGRVVIDLSDGDGEDEDFVLREGPDAEHVDELDVAALDESADDDG